jgi:hypothetical protein
MVVVDHSTICGRNLDFHHGLLYASVLSDSLFGMIPRALWPSKPVVMAAQQMIEMKLNLPTIDNTPGPLVYFYSAAGFGGVFCVYAVFGIFMVALTRLAVAGKSVAVWLLLVCGWSAVCNVEMDLLFQILIMARFAVLLYAIYFLFVFFSRQQGA